MQTNANTSLHKLRFRISGGCLTIATAQVYTVQTTVPILLVFFLFHSNATYIPNDNLDFFLFSDTVSFN